MDKIICAMLCVSFWSKLKEINVFPKNILKSKALDQFRKAKNGFVVIGKNYLCNILSFWSKACGGTKSKYKHPSWLYCTFGRTVRSSHQRCSIKKLYLKILQYHRKHLCWSLFLRKLLPCILSKKRSPNTGVFLCAMSIAKFLRLHLLKNIYEWLLFHCFNGSLP